MIGTEPIVTLPAFHNHDNLVAYTAVGIEGLSHSREGDILDFSHFGHIVQELLCMALAHIGIEHGEGIRNEFDVPVWFYTLWD